MEEFRCLGMDKIIDKLNFQKVMPTLSWLLGIDNCVFMIS